MPLLNPIDEEALKVLNQQINQPSPVVSPSPTPTMEPAAPITLPTNTGMRDSEISTLSKEVGQEPGIGDIMLQILGATPRGGRIASAIKGLQAQNEGYKAGRLNSLLKMQQQDAETARWQKDYDLKQQEAELNAQKTNLEIEGLQGKRSAEESLRSLDSPETQSVRSLAKQLSPRNSQLFDRMNGEQIYKYLPSVQEIMKSQMELVKTQSEIKNKEENARQGAGAGQVDKKFAEEYAKLQSEGGFAQDDASIKAAKDVVGSLKSGKISASGPILGNLPEAVRETINPQGEMIRNKAQNIVLPLVKKFFPGATSNWEGQTALKLVYNPRFSEAQNAELMQTWLDKIDKEVMNRKMATKYFEDNNFSLQGYKGQMPNFTGNPENTAQPKNKNKPKTVIQNGYTYNLNEETGEYE